MDGDGGRGWVCLSIYQPPIDSSIEHKHTHKTEHNQPHETKHTGGPARYVLAGSAEIGDSLYGKTALLVFARASDVESGAFRLLGANQRPVVLGAVRGGCKVRRLFCLLKATNSNANAPASPRTPKPSRTPQPHTTTHHTT